MSSKTAGQNSSLVLGEVFERFVKGSPVTVMARAAMENALRPEELERLFEATATSQYTRELLFSSLVNLMSLVVFKIRRTVPAPRLPQEFGCPRPGLLPQQSASSPESVGSAA